MDSPGASVSEPEFVPILDRSLLVDRDNDDDKEGESSSSDDDGDDDDNNNDIGDDCDDDDSENTFNNNRTHHEILDPDGQPFGHEVDANSSSSSSSEEDEEVEESEEDAAVIDGDVRNNNVDESSLLEQALALSLAEHNNSSTASATVEAGDGSDVGENNFRESTQIANSSMVVEDESDGDSGNSVDESQREVMSEGQEVQVSTSSSNIDNSTKVGENEDVNVENEDVNVENEGAGSKSLSDTSNSKPEYFELDDTDVLPSEEKNKKTMVLPPLPKPPSCILHLSGKGIPEKDQKEASSKYQSDDIEEFGSAWLDPSCLSEFGALSARNIIVHLLSFAVNTIQCQVTEDGRKSLDKNKLSDLSSLDDVVGGALFSPFSPNNIHEHLEKKEACAETGVENKSFSSQRNQITSHRGEHSSLDRNSTVVHLLVATLHILSNVRSESIQELQAALSDRDNNNLEKLDEKGTNDISLDDDKDIMDETDDPAFAVASPTATSPTAASARSSSEVLEEKGMRRKAAAAAHVAGLRRKNFQKRVETLSDLVQFYSLCSHLTMRCFRFYLQDLATNVSPLEFEQNTSEDTKKLKEMNLVYISPSAQVILKTTLLSYTSASISQSYQSLHVVDTSFKKQDALMLSLLHEGTALWGECVNLFCSSQGKLEDDLFTLLKQCFPSAFEDSRDPTKQFVSENLCLQDIGKRIPWTESEEKFLKLDAMCRRLRSRDMLLRFVPRPQAYDESQDNRMLTFFPTERQNSLISVLLKASHCLANSFIGSDKWNLTKFFYAICNCCNTNLILWNNPNLHAGDESVDAEDNTTNGSASSSGVTGDSKFRVLNDRSLGFDSTKCADSIAIIPPSPSNNNCPAANQRASKVWGTVLSTKCFNPKSGVHRWAVRLDKCERGHVFVGVATTRTSTKTYVGGDKHGWGVIGTQALWHDRRKIRGDYGGTFRSGATVIVTLDTDAGTLGFGIWNDPRTSFHEQSSSSERMSITSPVRSVWWKQNIGSIEDWGVAFEGLPLDTKLYPAVGLYQRDDRVSFLGVENRIQSAVGGAGLGICDSSTGDNFYPSNQNLVSCDDSEQAGLKNRREKLESVRKWNHTVCDKGISYASRILSYALELLSFSEENIVMDHELFTNVLPSLASSLCLSPSSIPVLSGIHAMTLLPLVVECVSLLEGKIGDNYCHLSPAKNIKSGVWTIRATPSTSASGTSHNHSEPFEEYVVQLQTRNSICDSGASFYGKGVGTTGRSANGRVTIIGASTGTTLQFVEEWTEGEQAKKALVSSSSCVIDARLNLDGSRFEGTYRNVQFGTTGVIAGMFDPDNRSCLGSNCEMDSLCSSIAPDDVDKVEDQESQRDLVRCCSLLSMAVGHLSAILCSGRPTKDVGAHLLTRSTLPLHRKEKLSFFVESSPVISFGVSQMDADKIKSFVKNIRELFPLPMKYIDQKCIEKIVKWLDQSFLSLTDSCGNKTMHRSPKMPEVVPDSVDAIVAQKAGGAGSLSALDPGTYSTTRKGVVRTLLYHTSPGFSATSVEFECSNEIIEIWQTALRIMESGTRASLLSSTSGRNRKQACQDFCNLADKISNFVCELHRSQLLSQERKSILTHIEKIYKLISCDEDIVYIKELLDAKTCQGILRYVGISTLTHCRPSSMKVTPVKECMLLPVGRLLGRGNLWNSASDCEVNGITSESPSPILAGCYFAVQEIVQSTAYDIFHDISTVMDTISREIKDLVKTNCISSSLQSLTLVVMSSFLFSFQDRDYNNIIERTGFWKFMENVFTYCQTALKYNVVENYHSDSLPAEAPPLILEAIRRHMDLNILKCTVSVLHTTLFQLGNSHLHNSSDATNSRMAMPISLLKLEIEKSLNMLKEKRLKQSNERGLSIVKIDYAKWKGASKKKPSTSAEARKAETKLSIGVQFLIIHGASGSQPKRSVAQGSTGSSEVLVSILSNAEHYLIHLSNALCSVLCPTSFLDSEIDIEWIKHILHSFCFNEDIENIDEGVLSVRFRVRFLRFLRLFLPRKSPDISMVESLFHHAGFTMDNLNTLKSSSYSDIVNDSFEHDAYLETKGVVSLLRHLYIPLSNESCGGALFSWRHAINSVIDTLSDEPNQDLLHSGIKIFLGGMPGRITVGSYVLLKPSAATSLSVSAPSLSAKSHGSSNLLGTSPSGIPPVVAGSGMEGIIAGLCRDEAMAGIISHIDINESACEIVLFTRNDFCSEAEEVMYDKAFTPNMTVRAVRGPLADVVSAEENALLLDSKFPLSKTISMSLSSSIQTVDSNISFNINEDESRICLAGSIGKNSTDISSAILSLRSCAVVLADSTLLRKYLTEDTSNVTKIYFSKLLALGSVVSVQDKYSYANAACSESLSGLPEYEARFWHLQGMLSNVKSRLTALTSTPTDKWYEKDTCSSETEDTPMKQEVNDEKIVQDGYSTPPATVGTVAGDFTTSLNSTAENDDANTDGQATRLASSATNSNSVESGNDDDDENEEAEEASRLSEETEAAHLREAAIVQMAELGLPRSWSEYALRRVGGANIEAAVHFCLERSGDMERLLAEEQERDRRMSSSASSVNISRSRRNASGGTSSGVNHLLRQLLEMGFPPHWCAEALAATGHNVDEALTWILTNGERLSALDEEDDDGDDDDEEEEAESTNDEEVATQDLGNDSNSVSVRSLRDELIEIEDKEKKISSTDNTAKDDSDGWAGGIICPLRSISGQANIDSRTLEVTGLPSGGFSSVGMKGVPLSSGKWYYEAVLITAGCLQIGWADSSFSGHCQADRGDGCGDGPSSWAYDGWRRYRWHSAATEWGCRWQSGDVVGCLLDMDNKEISFTLNGRGQDIGMGVAFSGDGFRPCGGVYACVSFNRREKIRLILGGEGNSSFRYTPPLGYQAVGESVLPIIKEMEYLLQEEESLAVNSGDIDKNEEKSYLCDFSDGEHGHELFAWQHRYYGSDASVHLGSASRSGSKGSSRSRRSLKNTVGSTLSYDDVGKVCAVSVNICLAKAWQVENKRASEVDPNEDKSALLVSQTMEKGYEMVINEIEEQIQDNNIALAILYARKFILQIAIALSSKFDLKMFISAPSMVADSETACRFWNIVEKCCSLQAAGWVGEAGAMAIASEALGLGISSNEHSLNRGSTQSVAGIVKFSGSNGDDCVTIPSGAITQFLSNVKIWDKPQSMTIFDPSASLASCAEAALGGEGGGLTVFLFQALQNALVHSEKLRQLVIALIRRSVRILAAIDHGSDGSSDEGNVDDVDMAHPDKGGSQFTDLLSSENFLPDARFVSFLTGLLLSQPVVNDLTSAGRSDVIYTTSNSLFEAWSIGLLSASMPWRMICALTVSGILNQYPKSFAAISRIETLKNWYNRLDTYVTRRLWAERAAVPICSKYVQALIELFSAVRKSSNILGLTNDEAHSTLSLERISVDASTPSPLNIVDTASNAMLDTSFRSWEWEENYISCDASWEIWTGSVDFLAVDWDTPSRSAVRSLMDGGEGPPMLREGCTVVRGLDWDAPGSGSSSGKEDGKDIYDTEKAARDEEKKKMNRKVEEPEGKNKITEDATRNTEKVKKTDTPPKPETPTKKVDVTKTDDEEDLSCTKLPEHKKDENSSSQNKTKKKMPSPKLPVGTVIAIEPWNGVPALGRRIRWNLTNEEGVYRYGGDGGRYDIVHVEVNEKSTRIRKRHPVPESAEQCASRYGFGSSRRYNVLLRMRKNGQQVQLDGETESVNEGILEWPDFGAGVRVKCKFYNDGAISLTEKELIFGSKDSGWEARFGQPAFESGTTIVLSPTQTTSSCIAIEDGIQSDNSTYEELLGSSSHVVNKLRNKSDGSKLRVTSEMRLLHYRRSPVTNSPSDLRNTVGSTPPPIHFDRDFHASSIALSRDGRTLTCATSEGRGTAFASVGFTKGVHYWEIKIEQAESGSVFIGVAEKPSSNLTSAGSLSSHDSQPRLNKWHGWGFVNFRATYNANGERVYGAHCHAGDTVGVLLDCDSGRVSFFFDGVKYGEHILNDLGCAFENVSPFGFNADGCGSGGAGQGAPNGIEGGRGGRHPANGVVRPKALWPVVGLRHPGDKVTMSSKWMTSYGVDGATWLRNALAVDEILCPYEKLDLSCDGSTEVSTSTSNEKCNEQTLSFPNWFITESYLEYERWHSGRWMRASSRGSGPHALSTYGLDVDVDTSTFACAAACASLGLKVVFLPGDRVAVKRSGGRLLELSEEAKILGAHQGRLWYQIVSQKSEGGSLTEGGGRAWFWDESEIVDGGIQIIGEGYGRNIELPLLKRFTCTAKGGIRVVYTGGAVIRSDLEIFDGSANIGTIAQGTIIPRADVLERRVNSCGVVRYRVNYEAVGTGWISSRIRGGKEEAIVEPVLLEDEVESASDSNVYDYPEQCARVWLDAYDKNDTTSIKTYHDWLVEDFQEFKGLISIGVIQGLSPRDSDAFLTSLLGLISDFSANGDAVECPFNDVLVALLCAFNNHYEKHYNVEMKSVNHAASHAVASKLSELNVPLPNIKVILVRIAMLRALNRRVKYALPWLPLRPPQENSAVLGGMSGLGASVERAGKSRTHATDTWFQASSIGSRIRSCRKLFFCSVKKSFLDGIVDSTTTPTPLSHDEYELPREVRTVRVNRLKARRAMNSTDGASKKKNSVFSQLQLELRGWSGAALRRGHVAKGHGGQKRAFKVKLIGEGVNDYSGPYREVFADATREVAEVENKGRIGILGVLEPSPNKAGDIGDGRNLCIFSHGNFDGVETSLHSSDYEYRQLVCDEERLIRKHYSSYITTKNEGARDAEESILFLGKLASVASRHNILVDLPLSLGLVWGCLSEENIDMLQTLKNVDEMAYRHWNEQKDKKDVSESPFFAIQQRMLNSFAEGISSILPLEVFPIFTSEELRDVFCGNTDVDVDLLQRVVEYEGYDEDDAVISYFWDALREMTTNERKLFLQFVWARSRLPMKESDFEAPFKIQKDFTNIGDNENAALPSASTCFFSIKLPEYTDKDTLKKKLLFAIKNVTTMESDYVTNDAEVDEGWRGL